MEVHKIYCDRQSCKKEITINVDLCPECAEKLKGILSEFFNEGCLAWTETGGEEISTEWKPVHSKF